MHSSVLAISLDHRVPLLEVASAVEVQQLVAGQRWEFVFAVLDDRQVASEAVREQGSLLVLFLGLAHESGRRSWLRAACECCSLAHGSASSQQS